MSHFAVLVTHTNEKDIATQLSPFDENREMPLQIYETKAELIAEGRRDLERTKEELDKYNADPEGYEKRCLKRELIEWLKNGASEEVRKLNSEEEIYRHSCRWYKYGLFDEDGNYLSTYNKNAKWDWYCVGGRYAGFFQSVRGVVGGQGVHAAKVFAEASKSFGIPTEEVGDLPEGACDVIQVKNIDWEAMDKAERDRLANYYDRQMAEPENRRFMFENGKTRKKFLAMTKEEYVNQPINHCTFAVLHKGKWYERGDMGWWGMVSDKKDEAEWSKQFKELINSLDPETEVTIVDCHI